MGEKRNNNFIEDISSETCKNRWVDILAKRRWVVLGCILLPVLVVVFLFLQDMDKREVPTPEKCADAIRNDCANVIEKQLDTYPSMVNMKTQNGETLLHFAARFGATVTARVIISKGGDINTLDHSGQTPLKYAVVNGKSDTVKLLLEQGADVELCGGNSFTPLLAASGYGSTEIVKLLLEHGAKLGERNKSGETPLFVAVMNEHTETVQVLLENGAECNVVNNDNLTPLIIAVTRGNLDIVKLLVRHGADVNISSNNDSFVSPLEYARTNKLNDIMIFLKNNGAR